MKKIIKKILTETLEDKKLQMAYVYLSNYMSTLAKFVDDNDDIHLREYRNQYDTVLIQKKSSRCWVEWQFWAKFSKEFSLDYEETQFVITTWAENTYELNNVFTTTPIQNYSYLI